MLVIAFLARAGSGKTTAAEFLRKNHGAVRLSFAGPLKYMAMMVGELSQCQVFGDKKEEMDDRLGMSPRSYLQRMGSAAKVCMGDEVWVHALLHKIKQEEEKGTEIVVVDDCRYMNEAKAMKALYNGHVIKIEADVPKMQHPSEAEVDLVPMDDITITLHNDKSLGLKSFEDQIQGVLLKCLGIFGPQHDEDTKGIKAEVPLESIDALRIALTDLNRAEASAWVFNNQDTEDSYDALRDAASSLIRRLENE